ncbi:MAG: hypothetical protein ABFR47_09225 [Verrucomicrobiota bacterium]
MSDRVALSDGTPIVVLTAEEGLAEIDLLDYAYVQGCSTSAEITRFRNLIHEHVITSTGMIRGEQATSRTYAAGTWLSLDDYSALQTLHAECSLLVDALDTGFGPDYGPDYDPEPTEKDISWPELTDDEPEVRGIPSISETGGMSTGLKVGLVAAGAASLLLVGTVLLRGKR